MMRQKVKLFTSVAVIGLGACLICAGCGSIDNADDTTMGAISSSQNVADQEETLTSLQTSSGDETIPEQDTTSVLDETSKQEDTTTDGVTTDQPTTSKMEDTTKSTITQSQATTQKQTTQKQTTTQSQTTTKSQTTSQPETTTQAPTTTTTTSASAASNGAFKTFSVSSLDGKTYTEDIFTKADLNVVIIWTTWCGYCKLEMPVLQTVMEKYSGESIQFFNLVCDVGTYATEDNAQYYMDTLGITYPCLIYNDSMSDGFMEELTGYPTTLYLDSEGNLLYKVPGSYAYNGDEYAISAHSSIIDYLLQN